jgi:hypothetical protein
MARVGTVAIGGVALAAVIAGGNGAAAAAEAIEITVSVLIVLAVVGLLAAIIIRARGKRQEYRPDPPVGPLRARAVIVGRNPPPSPFGPPWREGGREGGSASTSPLAITAGDRHADEGPASLAGRSPERY